MLLLQAFTQCHFICLSASLSRLPLSSSYDFINMNYLLLPVCRVSDLCRCYIKSRCRYKRCLAGRYSSLLASLTSPPPPLCWQWCTPHTPTRSALAPRRLSVHPSGACIASSRLTRPSGRPVHPRSSSQTWRWSPCSGPRPRAPRRPPAQRPRRPGRSAFFSFSRRRAAAVWRRDYYKSRGCVSECVWGGVAVVGRDVAQERPAARCY